MYKVMTFDELSTIKNPLFQTIHSLMVKQQTPYFKKFLQHQRKKGKQIIYCKRSSPIVQIGFDKEIPYIRDIVNRIELQLDDETIGQCHQLLKNQKKVQRLQQNNKSIEESLWDDFMQGENRLIGDKPYLVYDIETTYATNNLRDAKFLIAYIINSDPEKGGRFQHIPDIKAAELFQYMLDFDGYIIGYNHVGFDNPVLGYNAKASEEDIQRIQEKSLDPFLFLYQKLGRRVGLNALSKALVNVGKTLESGTEAEKLYNEYHKNGNQKAMKELKKYCKNDVKMTLLVWLALTEQKKLWREGEEITFSYEEFINGCRSHLDNTQSSQTGTSHTTTIFNRKISTE